MNVTASQVWNCIFANPAQFTSTSFETKGLMGASRRRRFAITEFKQNALILMGSETEPQTLRLRDFETVIRFQNREITRTEAHRQCRVSSYCIPLIEYYKSL